MSAEQPMTDPIRDAATGSPAVEIAKIEAAAQVVSWRCRHCDGRATIEPADRGPVAFRVEYRHQAGCPDDGWDGPAISTLTYEDPAQ